ncbi:MAG: hypothetical protein A4E62_02867 [Syntrophorhabdus sp. PtaU1.Bin002]|nr:MAG: hypothetical protein A4E62_02867 [Syntrophorhabdus sp. PtaU1.Bin002]
MTIFVNQHNHRKHNDKRQKGNYHFSMSSDYNSSTLMSPKYAHGERLGAVYPRGDPVHVRITKSTISKSLPLSILNDNRKCTIKL